MGPISAAATALCLAAVPARAPQAGALAFGCCLLAGTGTLSVWAWVRGIGRIPGRRVDVRPAGATAVGVAASAAAGLVAWAVSATVPAVPGGWLLRPLTKLWAQLFAQWYGAGAVVRPPHVLVTAVPPPSHAGLPSRLTVAAFIVFGGVGLARLLVPARLGRRWSAAWRAALATISTAMAEAWAQLAAWVQTLRWRAESDGMASTRPGWHGAVSHWLRWLWRSLGRRRPPAPARQRETAPPLRTPGLRLGRRVAQDDRARQQVRAAYRRVLAAAVRRGGRRQAGTTPRRYQEELLAQHAQLARWLPGLTAAYEEARYSRHRLAPDAVDRVRRGARRIVRFLQPPRQRRTARGSATTPPRGGR